MVAKLRRLAERLVDDRIERDDARIAELEEQVAEFLAEVDATLQRLQIVAGGPDARRAHAQHQLEISV